MVGTLISFGARPIFRGELLVLGSVKKKLAQGLAWLDFVIGLIGLEMVAVEQKARLHLQVFLGISEVSRMMLHIWNSFFSFISLEQFWNSFWTEDLRCLKRRQQLFSALLIRIPLQKWEIF